MIAGISSIAPVHQIPFGYKHPLKTLWRAGQFPTVTHGLYGDRLTQTNVSIDHIIPACKHGALRYDNLALASREKNSLRGNKDIRFFLTPEMAKRYLDQFKGIKLENVFYGSTYIKGIKRTLERLGIHVE